jgi:hypothetical protein
MKRIGWAPGLLLGVLVVAVGSSFWALGNHRDDRTRAIPTRLPPPREPVARDLDLGQSNPVAAPTAEVDTAKADTGKRDQPREIRLGGEVEMTAPAGWVAKTPTVRIIEYEFAVPAAKGDSADGRVTIMTAGGSVQANIDRWVGQFQPEGSKAEVKPKTESKKVAGREVHLVDLAGTYKDARGPFAPAVERPDYRMLAAIVPVGESNYFIKFYGPKATLAASEKDFRGMVEGLKEVKAAK